MSEREPHLSELVAAAGEVIYGDEWQNPMARALGLNERTVRRIAAAARAGEPYTVSPGAMRDLVDLLRRERKILETRIFKNTMLAGTIDRLLIERAKGQARS